MYVIAPRPSPHSVRAGAGRRPPPLLGLLAIDMALTAGIFVNAYRLEVPQGLRFWKLEPSRTAGRSKRQMQRELGVPLWFSGNAAYSVSPVAEATEIEVPAAADPPLTSFAIREALKSRAASLGWDSWFVMNEFNAVPPERARRQGPVLVDPVLKARVSHEGIEEREHIIILSSGVRWRMANDLRDANLAAVAPGETVFRLGGSGPERATVLRVEGDEVYLQVGREERERPVSAADYTLVARPAVVHSYLARTVGDIEARDVYRGVLVASGTLMADVMSPNRYAVKERYQSTEELMAEFGRSLELPMGRTVEVAAKPIEIFIGSKG
jgi:hypothetical protein